MATSKYIEDLLWLVGSSADPAISFDSSQAAVALPRRVPAQRGCSFQLFDPTKEPSGVNAAVKGTLTVSASNAPMRENRLVGTAFWVPVPELTVVLGPDNALPTLQQVLFPACGWVQLSWTPNGSQGQLAGRFDGPRP